MPVDPAHMTHDIDFAVPNDAAWIADAMTASWGGPSMAINGQLVDARVHRCLVARPRHGFLVFRDLPENGVEIIAIESLAPGLGIGRHLLDHLVKEAQSRGRAYLSATTTNDNLPAIRFYQRSGFRLFDLRVGAVDRARETLKPEIPLAGLDDVPIRDEIELRMSI